MKDRDTVGQKPRLMIAPGVAALLEGIKETGSISVAGHRIGMSHKRAWYLVEVMNCHSDRPLVEARNGGKAGDGAKLTRTVRTC